MPITVPPDVEEIVEQKVASGLYDSPDEVMRAALSLLEEMDQDDGHRLASLRNDIIEGIGSGSPVPASEAFERVRAKIRASYS
jgi:putative addiction module CopG family antidote